MRYSYDRRAKSDVDQLEIWGLEGLRTGAPVTLYHGTTALFRKFDLARSRDELVKNYYGNGIFLSPEKRIAAEYAQANRNIGFDPSIVADLKRRNAMAGRFLEILVKEGSDGWETAWKEFGYWNENPGPGEGKLDNAGFEKALGFDSNLIGDIADYVIGSASKPLGDENENPFFRSIGAPSYIYDSLDQVGLDSKRYRPKVYTVVVSVSKPLVTKSQAAASKAKSKGFDSVFYYGPDLVQGVPEVAVFRPQDVRIRHIEVV